MKLKIFILFIILSQYSIFAQYIKFNPFNFYSEISIAEKYQAFGFGSYGFNSRTNYFNPNYFAEDNNIGILVFGNMNLAANKRYGDGNQSIEYITNKTRLLPGFSINYKFDNYLANLCYINNFQLNGDVKSSNPIYFSTAGMGNYQLMPQNSFINIKNSVLQLSLSRKLGEAGSIALGVATNFFTYDYTFNNYQANFILKNYYDYELKTKGFNNYQFLAAFSHINDRGVSLYVLFKSGISNCGLEPARIFINDTISVTHHAVMNYPEHLAYGIQFNQFKFTSISLEILHEMELDKNSDVSTKISLGLNFHSFSPIDIGLLGSVYINKNFATAMDAYGNGPIVLIPPYSFNVNSTKHPFNINIMAGYNLDKLEFLLGYQYANGTYSIEGDTFDYRNFSSSLYFGIAYGLKSE